MPYKITAVRGGWKIKKDQPGRPVYFSKSPLTREKAEAQLKALYISERKRQRT
jgi:hypothetical protein